MSDPDVPDLNFDDLPTNYLQCRNFGHAWQPISVTHDPGSGAYEQGLRCMRCTAERSYVLDREGWFVKRRPYTYPSGYVFPKGTGRLDKHDRADLRVALVDRFTLSSSRRNNPGKEAEQ